MATITKTPSNIWKAVIRRRGWPTTIKTFRTKRDAEDWARRTEDDINRKAADVFRMALNNAVRPVDTDLIFWGEPGRDGKRRPHEFRPAWSRPASVIRKWRPSPGTNLCRC